jgi:dolichol-phosphate mannosyltransferase
MDRRAVDSVNAMGERSRYLPGLRAWVGYKNAIVYYDRQDRAGGDGKLSFVSRIKYAVDAITSFSYKPLRLSFALFLLTTGVAVLLGLSMLIPRSIIETAALGVSAAVFFVGGLLLLCLGVLGEYIGRVYDEVRSRPLSIISRVHISQVRASVPVGMIAVPGGNYRDKDEVTEAA